MTNDGLFLIDKGEGFTSHDAVALFRRASRIKRVGHSGTLDPFATGLLILCLEKATRLQSYLMNLEKTYEGTIRFGWSTDSYDPTGVVLGQAVPISVEHVDFEAAKKPFVGDFDQMPPAFSAKKVDGVRAYATARAGGTPQLKVKRVKISEFAILEVKGSQLSFRIRSSAGTYVRSIAHDLGAAIGVPAHLESLRRTLIGKFSVEDAVTTEVVKNATGPAFLQPPAFLSMSQVQLPFTEVRLDPMQHKKIVNGQTVVFKGSDPITVGDTLQLFSLSDEFIGIGEAIEVLREDGPVVIKGKVIL
ncbi:MAG TPA: tRNA pseudouridine(55) synthase TruB [Thermoanaerobaculia bacterium]|nr:tRNA pseudouridine(55) synthase TruB [Thermoanaerobaculia bacterium]